MQKARSYLRVLRLGELIRQQSSILPRLHGRKPKSGPRTSHAVSRRCNLSVPWRLKLLAAWPIYRVITVPWCEKGQYWQVVNMFVSRRRRTFFVRLLPHHCSVLSKVEVRKFHGETNLKCIFFCSRIWWNGQEVEHATGFLNECFLNLCLFCKAKLSRL